MSVGTHHLLGGTWYWTSYAYPDERTAERAWLRIEAVGKAYKGKLELGVYRHGSSVSGMVIVTALGVLREGVERADKVLQVNGWENDVPDDELAALISRRVRYVADLYAKGARSGSYEIRRTRGATLRPDGTYE